MTVGQQVSHRVHRVRHGARRVRQTWTDFENGGQLLARIASAPLTGRPAEIGFRVDDDLTVTVPNRPGARVPVYEVFAEDAYRLPWFTGDLGPDAVAVDIGGHVGCFALAFARQHPQGRVASFEASPATAAYLERNVGDNGLDGRVLPHRLAVSDAEGTLEFADNAGGSSLNGLTAPEGAATISVPCVTIAQALALAGKPVDVVKIDTEGAEYAMVLASAPEDWAEVQRVVLEYHDVPGHGWPELASFFTAAGFREVGHQPENPRQGTVWLARTALS